MAKAKFVSAMTFVTPKCSRLVKPEELEARRKAREAKPYAGDENFIHRMFMQSLHDSIVSEIFKPVEDAYEQERNRALNFLKTRGV